MVASVTSRFRNLLALFLQEKVIFKKKNYRRNILSKYNERDASINLR